MTGKSKAPIKETAVVEETSKSDANQETPEVTNVEVKDSLNKLKATVNEVNKVENFRETLENKKESSISKQNAIYQAMAGMVVIRN